MAGSGELIALALRWLVAGVALVVLAALVYGVIRAHVGPPGRTTRAASLVLRGRVQVVISLLLLAVSVVLWRPLPVEPSDPLRPWIDATGALLALMGLALVLWGRLTLGHLYDVSSVGGVRLRPSHRLVTEGPFRYVRHPMYVGVELAAIGGLLLYRTWTLAFLTVAFLGLVFRAAREDEALQLEFGEEWTAYRLHVPAWLPHFRRSRPG
ncbi:MAG TPA: isoprenylcysteine carboxylmethyltransferase family protein [Candidatus Limnocylindria bacterium]|nr:isoprenylcysteine carboxylmethyltransferase family protein [Candidatus Limnocylindria bacterium]